jgi:hypothetical protein
MVGDSVRVVDEDGSERLVSLREAMRIPLLDAQTERG